MGEWIKRRVNEHQHDMPVSLDIKAVYGDTWRCECGKTFRIMGLTFHSASDPRENDYHTAEWDEVLGQRDV